MDDDSQEDKPNNFSFSRYRSPTFNIDEIKTLLNLIESCKSVVLDKSTSTAACHAKEAAWFNIAKTFNSKGFKHERSVESLKMKWDNLKKAAKKLSKNIFEMYLNEFDDVTSRTVEMMSEAENMSSALEKSMDLDKTLNVNQKQALDWNVEEDDDSHDNDDDNEYNKSRSINFTPQECNLLIQCVKQEKKFVLTKDTTAGVNKLKNKAWFRITNNYNKISPRKRSTKVLRTKFTNMKRMVKSVNFKDYLNYNRKHNKLIEDDDQEIKTEPSYEYNDHSDSEIYPVDDEHSEVNEMPRSNTNFIPDPLDTAINGDSGIDILNPIDNKEIVRLKMELLKYKMESAKLERKRIEESLRTQALENSLRLRTARLEAVAAAMKLPPTHPALAYTPQEEPAEQYLTQCT